MSRRDRAVVAVIIVYITALVVLRVSWPETFAQVFGPPG